MYVYDVHTYILFLVVYISFNIILTILSKTKSGSKLLKLFSAVQGERRNDNIESELGKKKLDFFCLYCMDMNAHISYIGKR